nr:MmgE/PrpD family protein [Aeromicrobium wangtongii]
MPAASRIPPDVQAKMQTHLADSVAIAHAASVRRVGRDITAVAARSGGNGPARVLGSTSVRLGPTGAAFANAALVHALDLDDIHDAARLHPTAVTLPAALAAADLVGADQAGVARAAAVGNELMCRLGTAVAPDGTGPASGWFLTQLLGYVGAAVTAGLLLGLDEAAVVSSIGLATMQAAGAKQAGFGTGSTARAIYPAFAAEGGVRSALLAEGGFVGPARGLDGEAGMFPLYLGGRLDASQARRLVDSERRWDFLDTQLKRWPSCRLSHPYIAATLRARPLVPADRVSRIVVEANRAAARLCRPLESRTRPVTLADAKYSVPFMVAFTLVHGEPTLAGLTDASLTDAAVLHVASLVEVVETGTDSPGEPGAHIAFTGDGHQEIVTATGTPPMSPAEARRKLAACLAGSSSDDLPFVPG